MGPDTPGLFGGGSQRGFGLRNHRAGLCELLLPFHSHCLFSLFHTRILIHFISVSFFFATADCCLGIPPPHTQAITVSGRVSLNICRGPFQWILMLAHLKAALLSSQLHYCRCRATNETAVLLSFRGTPLLQMSPWAQQEMLCPFKFLFPGSFSACNVS